MTDYQFDKNTHTDSHFLQETLSQMEKSEEEIILVTDGGYDGQDNAMFCPRHHDIVIFLAFHQLGTIIT